MRRPHTGRHCSCDRCGDLAHCGILRRRGLLSWCCRLLCDGRLLRGLGCWLSGRLGKAIIRVPLSGCRLLLSCRITSSSLSLSNLLLCCTLLLSLHFRNHFSAWDRRLLNARNWSLLLGRLLLSGLLPDDAYLRCLRLICHAFLLLSS